MRKHNATLGLMTVRQVFYFDFSILNKRLQILLATASEISAWRRPFAELLITAAARPQLADKYENDQSCDGA